MQRLQSWQRWQRLHCLQRLQRSSVACNHCNVYNAYNAYNVWNTPWARAQCSPNRSRLAHASQSADVDTNPTRAETKGAAGVALDRIGFSAVWQGVPGAFKGGTHRVLDQAVPTTHRCTRLCIRCSSRGSRSSAFRPTGCSSPVSTHCTISRSRYIFI